MDFMITEQPENVKKLTILPHFSFAHFSCLFYLIHFFYPACFT